MKFTKYISSLFTKYPPTVVIVGPTASGKSSLAIALAKKYNGEVVSCDSRQIYKGLEIFSGAVTHKTDGGVKHHLVSFMNPGEIYSADAFVKQSLPIIDSLHKNEQLPVVAGGTGFFAKSLLYEKDFPPVEPDYEFRETLHKYTTQELFEMLHSHDPRRAKQADPHNRKRLVRALEIIEALGTVPITRDVSRKKYRFIVVYLKPSKQELDERIRKNVSQRMNEGLLQEAEKTLVGLSRQQVEELGLGFKHLYDLQEGVITKEEFVDEMSREEIRYAKRQKTFLNKMFKEYGGKKILIETIDQEERVRNVVRFLC